MKEAIDGQRVRPGRSADRDEAIAAAGEVYGAILADPERREQLRAHRGSEGCIRTGLGPSMTAPQLGPDGPIYLTTREVADRFRTAPSTVNEWRQRGIGPLGIRFGKNVLYPLPEVEAWEQRRIDAAKREHDQKGGRAR